MQAGYTVIVSQLDSGKWQAFRNGQQIDSKDLSIGPNSVDVTLHQKILIPTFPDDLGVLDPYDADCGVDWQEIIIPETGYQLAIGECVLGAVNERFSCMVPYAHNGMHYHFKPDIDGRSTVGRIFLQVHQTAGFGDYGFCGAFTLEIKNSFTAPIVIYPHMRIAQVFFNQVLLPVSYSGAYSREDHFDGPVAPVLGRDRF